jgi:UTP-glucose-1-phosphate uridylyltransferase
VSHSRSKTDKKPIVENRKLSMIRERDSAKLNETEVVSIGNDENVKDYFDNKISLRRSIEKKLHYDTKNAQNKAAGLGYQTSAQKHQ